MRITKKNPLLDENKRPYSFFKRYGNYPPFQECDIKFINASSVYLSLSNNLSEALRNAMRIERDKLSNYFFSLQIYANIYIHSGITITLNRSYWGGDIIKCEIENAVFFWLISISPLKTFLPDIIRELSQSFSPRKIVYWLRYADVQTSEITKLLPTSNKNVYRWVSLFQESELKRLANEAICHYFKYRYRYIDYYDFIKGKKKLYVTIYSLSKRKDIILASYSFKELIDIDNLNGEFKRHIRRTKAEIEAERKKNL